MKCNTNRERKRLSFWNQEFKIDYTLNRHLFNNMKKKKKTEWMLKERYILLYIIFIAYAYPKKKKKGKREQWIYRKAKTYTYKIICLQINSTTILHWSVSEEDQPTVPLLDTYFPLLNLFFTFYYQS